MPSSRAHDASIPTHFQTLGELLAWRAETHPERTAYVFLERGVEVGKLNYAELHAEARAVASRLQAMGAEGQRALLLYPSGAEYVVAFWGCLLAGTVAVPAYPPHNQRTLARLSAIARDAEPAIVLTTSSLHLALRARLLTEPSLWASKWLATDRVRPRRDPAPPAAPRADDLAFLQYTSGSTSAPKGVMVSHRNLMINAAMIHTAFEMTPASVAVCWVPLYHDLGLIGHMLQAGYGGFACVIMSPLDFLAEPRLWLEAIDRYGGTHSGAPNFAFDLCCRKIAPEARAGLDLSRWVLASNCAEPVRADTMDRFSRAFAPAGFRHESFRPTYGLAEVTLLASIDPLLTPPVVRSLDPEALARHEARASDAADAARVVGCGEAWGDQRLTIVDPEHLTPCPDGTIGEVWITGGNVAGGYWRQPEASAATFGARTAQGEGPFLRTGDMGYWQDGSLFLTGRLKDMIILRGQNLYPQDLERTVEEADAGLRPGCSAAFSIDMGDEERLVVVAEVARGFDPKAAPAAFAAVRSALAERHGLPVYAVALLQAGTVPKTSSGKIQRRAAREAFQAGRLKELARDTLTEAAWLEAAEPEAPEAPETPATPAAPPAGDLPALVAEVWAEVLGLQRVDPAANFFDLGGSSMLAVRAAAQLRERTGIALPLVELFRYPTVNALAARLAAERPAAAAGPRRHAPATSDVAIVGMAVRVPEAADAEAFWRRLTAGAEARRTFDDAALAAAGVSADLLADPRYVKAGAVLEGIERFDAAFFGLTPREAALLDPQQRIFLETAWAALEDAGHAAGQRAEVGVFAGVGANQYFAHHLAPNQALVAALDDFSLALAIDKDFLATRVAYQLDLTGPALTVQTACSTSLVAVHLACQSLIAGECEMAIAGGAAINVRQAQGYLHVEGGVRSPDGRCRAFDAGAAGTPFSSGAGAVVLKRLEDALKDGDTVHAVIKASAINNDGAGKAGFTAPSVDGQARVIAEALSLAGVPVETIGYVEAHGTATALGDPIEVLGLTEAFSTFTDRRGFCALGSVKTNLGHLDVAAGVVGLIKAALCVKHGLIPPSLHYERPNPEIDFGKSPFFVARELSAWEPEGHPRRAGVSAFGIGGTNAHAVLEQFVPEPVEQAPPSPQLLVLSARTPQALERAAARLQSHLERHRDTLELGDVASTLQRGRKAFRHRLMLVAESVEAAIAALAERDPARVLTAEAPDRAPRVVFMIPGQGAQHPDMGRGLYETEPVFRQAMDRCSELLAPHLGLDLREALYGQAIAPEALYRPRWAQPALFALAYASAALWADAGLPPQAMIGHSLGEYVAACLAGACSLEDALALVAARGRLFEEVSGAMATVGLDEASLAPRLVGGVAIAAINGPALTTVAGEEAAIEALLASLAAEGIKGRRLPLPHAAHCPLVTPMAAPLAEAAAAVAWQPPAVPYLSNVTGDWVDSAEAIGPAYWVSHLHAPVRFAEGLARAAEDALLLDLGPGQTLAVFARQQPGGATVLSAMRHPQDPAHDRAAFLAAIGRAWLAGAPVRWERAQDWPGRRVPLPTYPFERQRHWIEPPDRQAPQPWVEAFVEAAPEATARATERPRTAAEACVAAIFSELLGLPDVGRHDHFFESGGHSLVATQAIARIRRDLGAELQLTDVFAAPTVAALAARATRAAGSTLAPIPPLDREGALPLTFAQERMWFFERLSPGPLYNLPHAARLTGSLDVDALEGALTALVERHEGLRTVFPADGGRAVQRILPPPPASGLRRVDLTDAPAPEAAARRLADEEAQRPFDLAEGPLWRPTLYRLGPQDHVLLLAMHHIVADGWSMGVLVRELASFYQAFAAGKPPSLPPLRAQMADVAAWQRSRLAAPEAASGLAYWRERLAAPLPRLRLPADHPEAPPSDRGARLQRMLPRTLDGRVAALAHAHGATPFMVYFAAYQTLLHRLTGQTDMLVSVPVADRPHPDAEALIGFFVNSLALRGDLSGDPTFLALLGRVREAAFGAFAHAHVPLQHVVAAVAPERDGGGLGWVEAAFALQNAPMPAMALGEVALAPFGLETRTAKLDLLLDLTPRERGVEAAIEYRADRFEAATIAGWLDDYVALLEAIVEAPETRLSTLAPAAPTSREALYQQSNLSENQLLIWLGHQLHAEVPLYTLATATNLPPGLDVEAFRRALAMVVEASDALRMVIETSRGVPTQRVLPSMPTAVEATAIAPETLDATLQERLARPMRLSERLFDTALYQLPDRWVWYFAMHHIVGDGGAMAAVHRHVTALYARLAAGSAVAPVALPAYLPHVLALRARSASSDHARHQAYWRRQLAASADPASFFGRAPAHGGTQVVREHLTFGLERSARLREAAKGPLGPFTAFATALFALMHRHSGGRRLALGAPVHHRASQADLDMIGLRMTLLPLRIALDPADTLAGLRERVTEAAIAMLEHGEVTLANPDAGRAYDVALNYMDHRLAGTEGMRWLHGGHELDTLFLQVHDHGPSRPFSLELDFHEAVFDAPRRAGLIGQLLAVIDAWLDDPDQPVGAVDWLCDADRRAIALAQGPPIEVPETTAVALFEAQARLRPASPAVTAAGVTLSYGELDAAAEALARRLRALGVGPEARVGLCLDRSVELLVGLLGILKAGGAYVPLDPDYPADRLAFMLEDSEPTALVTRSDLERRLPETGLPTLRLDLLEETPADAPPASPPDGSALAYVIYTSGSTGRPKGVAVEHRQLLNAALAWQQAYALEAKDVHLQLASVAFDVFTGDWVRALCFGARLVVAQAEVRLDPPALAALMAAEGVTAAEFVPSVLRELCAHMARAGLDFPAMRLMVAGSEAWSLSELAEVRRRFAADTRVVSSYGLTEATVDSTYFEDSSAPADDQTVPLGRAFAGMGLRVADAAGRAVPVGVPGEILVGGAGVARGYWRRPALTAERFVTLPGALGRWYRTGDRGFLLPDGTLCFAGRDDAQVKVRGQRVEPGEIEAALRAHPAIAEAAVLLDAASGQLVAYIAPRAGEEASLEAARVAEWERIYDADASASAPDPTFDVSGWISSFSGQPIPEHEMRDWVAQTVGRLRALSPRRVLEIGVGSGLLLFPLAEEASDYLGTDFSSPSLARLTPHLGLWPHVRIEARQADDFAGLPPGGFDLVVVNSVIQYFPGEAYLRRVIEGAIAQAAPQGAVFIGDVRASALLAAFHAAIEHHRAPGADPAALRARIERAMTLEPELLVDPAIFEGWPGVSRVEVQLKRGPHRNEMTAFRYDVILHRGEAVPRPAAPCLEWPSEGLTPEALGQKLTAAGDALAVLGLPDARLHEATAALAIAGLGPASVAPAIEPEAIYALAEARGLDAEVRFSSSRPGHLDVLFTRPGATGRVAFPTGPVPAALTNDPLAAMREREGAASARAWLEARLPAAMVPSRWRIMPALPRLPNGKLDRAALPAIEAPVAQDTTAPETETERLLAALYAEVLGLAHVGREDGFFALGGDSIMSLQVVAKAQERGLALTPRMLFEHQTVAALATAVGGAPVRAAEGPVAGPAPLTPIQAWFFSLGSPAPHHFNQSLLLSVGRRLEPSVLGLALADMLAHHDMLRARYERGPAGWTQTIAERAEAPEVLVYDLSAMPEAAQNQAIEALTAGLQASLDLAGPLLRAASFRLGPTRGDRLFLAVHHLVVDGVSWRILLEDLQAAYARREAGEAAVLPARTASFRAWGEQLSGFTSRVEDERRYWKGQPWHAATPLPVDHPEGANTAGSARTVTIALGTEATRGLLEEAPRAYATGPAEALVAALAIALGRWTGGERHAVMLEGHGREAEDLDLSRTVGWFTTLYPLLLTHAVEPGEALVLAKEAMRGVPRRGLGYGLLAPDDPVLSALRPALSFNYLGRFGAELDGTGLFAFAPEAAGSPHAPAMTRPQAIAVDCLIVEGELRAHWTYSDLHDPATIEGLAAAHMAALEAILAHCLAPGAGAHTPSDFPLARLTPRELARLVGDSRPQAPAIEAIDPLTPMQQGMLFHSLLTPEDGAYVVQASIALEGPLDAARFERAWRETVERHGVMRTSFHWEGLAAPVQVVHREARLPWVALDWSMDPPEEQSARLEALLAEARTQGFQPEVAPLMRLALVRLGPDRHRFLWSAHHALLDGWASALLVEEVFRRYAGEAPGPAPRPFRDHVAWLAGRDATAAEAYWREALRGHVAPTPLPLEAPSGASGRAEASLTLGLEAVRALSAAARGRSLTLNALVEGAWALLLTRLTGERAVVFGAVSAGRPAELTGSQAMIGPFLATLPVPAVAEPETPLGEWLQALQAQRAEARQHEHLALPAIHAQSAVPRQMPLFESLVVFENYPVEAARRQGLGGLRAGEMITRDQTHYALTLTVLPGETLTLRANVDAARLDEAAAGRLLAMLKTMLEAMPGGLDAPVAELSWLPEAERPAALEGPQAGSPAPAGTIHGRFEAQARLRPASPAVTAAGVTLSYGELDAAAEALARRLRALGVGPEARVGLCLDRSVELLVGLLGILKAGGAYVPLDPDYPADRLAFMLEDSEPTALVTRSDLERRLPETGLPTLRLDIIEETSADAPPASPPDGSSLAYLIYTSGSTGRPKGVAVEHRQVVNLLSHFEPLLAPGDRLLAVTTLAFDIAALELLLPLTVGATVAIAPRETARDGQALAQAIAATRPTVMQATPATWRLLLAAGWPGDAGLTILTGGEALPQDLAEALLGKGQAVWNVYGPTETTIWSSSWRVTPGPVRVGLPVARTRLLVVDERLAPLPPGLPGELLIGGAGVARGYWQRPALTAERFVTLSGTPGRWYRTGDRAVIGPDGTVSVTGRLDDQIKLYGHRIEPGEIEAALRAHPGVADAAVAVREDQPGQRWLVAYVVPAAGAEVPPDMRAFLAARLPAPMLPARTVALAALPRTPNGKLDRRALPAPTAERPDTGAPYEPPATDLESAITEVLQAVLGLERVGALDHFFELGGNSLLAMQALGRLRQALGREIPLVAIFRHPHARALAAYLQGEASVSTTEAVERGEERQRRLAARRASRRGGTDA